MNYRTKDRIRGASKSKMVWLSGLLVAIGAAEVALPGVKDQLGAYSGWVSMGTGVVTATLRWVTTKDLADK